MKIMMLGALLCGGSLGLLHLSACSKNGPIYADLGAHDLSASAVDFSTSTDGGVGDPDAGPTVDLATGTASAMMSFFVTSTGSGAIGGNFGGIIGGDQKCQSLGAAAGQGGKVWHAYLSDGNEDARDRIGAGPWYNFAGTMIAANVSALHNMNGGIVEGNILTETGQKVPAAEHGIVTGTSANGTNANSCNDWTVNNGGSDATLGYSDWETTVTTNDRWNSGAKTNGCSQASLVTAMSTGRIYCFETN